MASAYCAAKHDIDGFVEFLRVKRQHEGAGVSVTQVMPEAVAIPFFEHARSRVGVRASGPPPLTTPEKVAEVVLRAAEHGGRDIPVGGAAHLQDPWRSDQHPPLETGHTNNGSKSQR